MGPGPTRRSVLQTVGTGLCGLSVGWMTVWRSAAYPGSEPFDPAINGFNFRNWSTRAPDYPEHHHASVSEDQFKRTIRQDWRDPIEDLFDEDVNAFPRALVDVIAKQIYVSANQYSATNGHCYGMTFTAQTYFGTPSVIPLDRATASEFYNPSVPLDDQTQGPVGRNIDGFQTQQVLDPLAWIGRRALVRPKMDRRLNAADSSDGGRQRVRNGRNYARRHRYLSQSSSTRL